MYAYVCVSACTYTKKYQNGSIVIIMFYTKLNQTKLYQSDV
jgi:hypothetical protein